MSLVENLYKRNKIDYLNLKKYLNESIFLLTGGAKSKSLSSIDLTKNIISEKDLISYIEEHTKATYQAVYDDDGKLSNNVANNGLTQGQLAIREGGEYNGLIIRATEEIKPILTDVRVIRVIRHLMSGVLRLNDEIFEHIASNPNDRIGLGLTLTYSVHKYWLEKNDIPVPKEYEDTAIEIKSKNMILL